LIVGGITGAIIGGIIAVTRVEKRTGAFIGGSIGVLLAGYFISGTVSLELADIILGLSCILAGAAVGWIVVQVTGSQG
jgi:hypothetical protein